MLKNAIESANDYFDSRKHRFCRQCSPRRLVPSYGVSAEPRTMAVFHHARLHALGNFCKPKVNMRRTIVIALTVLLAGCMVGPNYVRPKVDVPTSFRYEEKEAKETVNTIWWEQFRDPVLDGLIAEALANNKDIKIAAANIEKAAAVLTQVRSPFLPQLGYGGSATRERATEECATPVPLGVPNPQLHTRSLQAQVGRSTFGAESGGAPRRDPLAGFLGSERLYPAPWPGPAASGSETHPCQL